MDPNKVKALVTWVNSVCNNVVEDIDQLWDGKSLMTIVTQIDAKFSTEDVDNPKDRIKKVLEYLQDCYPGQNIQLTWSRIIFERNKREIAKMVTLLLIQAVQCSNREFFVRLITKNDTSTQAQIMKIIEFICDGEMSVLRSDYSQILCVAEGTASCNSSLNESNACGSANASFISSGPVTRLYSNSPAYESSPVRLFLNSPQMKSRIMQREVKKLEVALSNEAHLREEKEQEVEEKAQTIVALETKLSQTRQELHDLRSLQYAAEDLKNANVMREKAEAEVCRLRTRIEELSHYKSENMKMEEKLRVVSDEKYSLEQAVKDKQKVVQSREQYRAALHEARIEMDKMKMKIGHFHQQYQSSNEEKEQLKQMFKEQEVLMKQKITDLEEDLCKKANEEPSGESMGLILEQRIMDLEKENANLKATYVPVEQLHQLKKEMLSLHTAKEQISESYQQANTQAMALQSEVQRLMEDVAAKETENGRLVASMQDAKREMERLVGSQNSELESLNTQLKQADLEKGRLAEESSSLQREVLRLRNVAGEAEKEAETNRAEVERLSSSLQVVKEAGETHRAGLTGDVEKLTESLASAEKAKEAIAAERNRLELECAAVKQKMSTVENECEQYRTAAERQRHVAEDEGRKADALERQLRDQQAFFKGMIEKLNEETQTLKSQSRDREFQLQEEVLGLKRCQQQQQTAWENQRWAEAEKTKALTEEVAAAQKYSEKLKAKMASDAKAYEDMNRNVSEECQRALDERSSVVAELRERLKSGESRRQAEKEQYEKEVEGLEDARKERDSCKAELERTKAELGCKLEELHAARAEIEKQRAEVVRKTQENARTEDEATRRIQEMEKALEAKMRAADERSGAEADQAQSLRRDLEAELLKITNQRKNYNTINREMERKMKESEARGDQYKARLQKVVRELHVVKSVSEKSNEKLSTEIEKCKKLSSENSRLQGEVQALQTERVSLKEKDASYRQEVREVNLRLQEEKKTNTSLSQRLRNLEVQLDFANKLIRDNQKKAAEPVNISPSANTTVGEEEEIPLGLEGEEESLRNDKAGFHDATLNLSDLGMNFSGRSHFGSPDSMMMDFDGFESNRSKGGSTLFEITMTSKKSLNMSNASSFLEFGNTIPELATSTSSVGGPVASKQTTARAGFVFMNTCEDEPEHFDWGRVSELQRRNTLCLPHMRSAYPIETQYATPGKAEEKNLKENVEQRKRKAGVGDGNDPSPRKLRALSNRRRATLLECPAPSAHNTQQTQATEVKKDNVAFSIGFTPQKQKPKFRTSMRLKQRAANFLKPDKGKKTQTKK